MADRAKALTVDLGELKLPAAAIDRIEQAVQKAVLLELASMDSAPVFQVAMTRPGGKGIPGLLDPRTRGIVIKPPAKGTVG
jgi:hypothetical protein